ncbi:hypothetical protein TNCV_1009291 [Trichonephila clavipes]|nr:hypothetical protein TNCV_1009291 [Trichonephila clavipes]
MRLQSVGTVDGYEWRCRNQSKDNRHDVVRSVRKGTWFSESKLAITIILRLTRYWFDKSMNEFVMNDLKVNKNMTKLIRHMWRRSYDHKLVNESFHKFLASIARVYQPTDHDEMQASVESDLRVSLVNNGLVGPYSATVLVTLPSAPDHRPPRLASAR